MSQGTTLVVPILGFFFGFPAGFSPRHNGFSHDLVSPTEVG